MRHFFINKQVKVDMRKTGEKDAYIVFDARGQNSVDGTFNCPPEYSSFSDLASASPDVCSATGYVKSFDPLIDCLQQYNSSDLGSASPRVCSTTGYVNSYVHLTVPQCTAASLI